MYVKVTGKNAGTVTLSLTDMAGNVQTPVITVGSGKSSDRVESGGDKVGSGESDSSSKEEVSYNLITEKELTFVIESILKELLGEGIRINGQCPKGKMFNIEGECVKKTVDLRFEMKKRKLDGIVEALFMKYDLYSLKLISQKARDIKRYSGDEFTIKVLDYLGQEIDAKILSEEIQLTKELITYYGDLGLDISGLKSTGQGLGSVTAFWLGYINDDPYLKNQVDLQNDLAAVGSELNPVKKLEKLKAFGKKIKKNKTVFIGGKKIDSDYFHREIKPKILAKAGKFDWKVGTNPDVSVKNGKIILIGSSKGPFKNKKFETNLNFNDFIN